MVEDGLVSNVVCERVVCACVTKLHVRMSYVKECEGVVRERIV